MNAKAVVKGRRGKWITHGLSAGVIALLLLVMQGGLAVAVPPWTEDIEDLQKRVADLEVGAAALQDRVAQLEAASQPLTLEVDCGAGETVGAALAATAAHGGPLTLLIRGVCDEHVRLDRDDVTLRGTLPGAGFSSTGVVGPLVEIAGARRIRVLELTFSPGPTEQAIRAAGGAQALVDTVEIDGGQSGVLVNTGSVMELRGAEISNVVEMGIGVNNSHLVVVNTVIRDSGTGLSVNTGTAQALGVTSANHDAWGFSVSANGSLQLVDSEAHGNAVGLFLTAGAEALVGGNSRLHDNRGAGIRVWEQSVLFLGGGSVVEDNGSHGVLVWAGSLVVPTATTIQNNGGSGIYLGDTSLAGVRSPDPTITANAGWGIFCEGAPAVAQIQSPGYGAGAVFGNTAGEVNCP